VFYALIAVLIAPGSLLLGITQGWGVVALLVLGVIFVYFFYEERPAGVTLPLASLVAWIETLRALWQEEALEHARATPSLVALGAWCLATALYVVFVLRPRTRVGPI
jgi:hypothetical protein